MTSQREQDIEQVMTGAEPAFGDKPISRIVLIRSLNWYSANRDKKNSQKYIADYLKKMKVNPDEEIIEKQTTSFGWLCRMASRGAIFDAKEQSYFDGVIKTLKKAPQEPVPEVIAVANTNFVSVRDRVEEKARECMGELEGAIDTLIHTKFKKEPKPLGIMIEYGVKGMHGTLIVSEFKKQRDYLESVITTKDADIKEGYSNFTKMQLKKLVAYIQQIIDDAQSIIGQAIKTRKPRKRKVKTAEQLMGKIKFCEGDDKLGIKSIDPKKIIGASTLWIYNIKTRKLGCYVADDASGFGFKGTSVLNFSELKSVSKKLRKPEDVVPKVVKEGKVYMRNVLSEIRAKESPLTGRINSDTILLRVI